MRKKLLLPAHCIWVPFPKAEQDQIGDIYAPCEIIHNEKGERGNPAAYFCPEENNRVLISFPSSFVASYL
jgi:hypothetical protein